MSTDIFHDPIEHPDAIDKKSPIINAPPTTPDFSPVGHTSAVPAHSAGDRTLLAGASEPHTHRVPQLESRQQDGDSLDSFLNFDCPVRTVPSDLDEVFSELSVGSDMRRFTPVGASPPSPDVPRNQPKITHDSLSCDSQSISSLLSRISPSSFLEDLFDVPRNQPKITQDSLSCDSQSISSPLSRISPSSFLEDLFSKPVQVSNTHRSPADISPVRSGDQHRMQPDALQDRSSSSNNVEPVRKTFADSAPSMLVDDTRISSGQGGGPALSPSQSQPHKVWSADESLSLAAWTASRTVWSSDETASFCFSLKKNVEKLTIFDSWKRHARAPSVKEIISQLEIYLSVLQLLGCSHQTLSEVADHCKALCVIEKATRGKKHGSFPMTSAMCGPSVIQASVVLAVFHHVEGAIFNYCVAHRLVSSSSSYERGTEKTRSSGLHNHLELIEGADQTSASETPQETVGDIAVALRAFSGKLVQGVGLSQHEIVDFYENYLLFLELLSWDSLKLRMEREELEPLLALIYDRTLLSMCSSVIITPVSVLPHPGAAEEQLLSDFFGREDHVFAITNRLKKGPERALILGTSGVGKTSLSLVSACRLSCAWPRQFTFLCTSLAVLWHSVCEFALIAGLIDQKSRRSWHANAVWMKVIRYLSKKGTEPILLIFDGIEVWAAVEQLITPLSNHHAVIATSTMHPSEKLSFDLTIHLQPLKAHDSARVFTCNLGIPSRKLWLIDDWELAQSDATLQDVVRQRVPCHSDEEGFAKLRHFLEKYLCNLPRALRLAGQFIRKSDCSIVKLLKQFSDPRAVAARESSDYVAAARYAMSITATNVFYQARTHVRNLGFVISLIAAPTVPVALLSTLEEAYKVQEAVSVLLECGLVSRTGREHQELITMPVWIQTTLSYMFAQRYSWTFRQEILTKVVTGLRSFLSSWKGDPIVKSCAACCAIKFLTSLKEKDLFDQLGVFQDEQVEFVARLQIALGRDLAVFFGTRRPCSHFVLHVDHAIDLLRKSIDRAVCHSVTHLLAGLCFELCAILVDCGRAKEAVAECNRVWHLVPPDPPDVLSALKVELTKRLNVALFCGKTLSTEGKYVAAVPYFTQVYDDVLKAGLLCTELQADIGVEYGFALEQVGQLAKATTVLQRSLFLLTKMFGSASSRPAACLSVLGDLYCRTGDLGFGRMAYADAMDRIEVSGDGGDLTTVINTHIGLGKREMLPISDAAECRRHLQYAARVAERSFGPSSAMAALVFGHRALLEESLGNTQIAERLRGKFLPTLKKSFGAEHDLVKALNK